MLQIRPVVLQRIERADRQVSAHNSLCHGNVSHTCPIERESDRKIAGDADELAMNQYSTHGGGGGDQLIIGTVAARARGTPPASRYV